jgi:hypothetical protein
LTAQATPKLGSSSNTKELAKLISEDLVAAFEERTRQKEAAEDVEIHEETQNEKKPLLAWVSNYSGSLNVDILPLKISEAEIQSLIDRSGEDYSLVGALRKLNTMQRRMILRNVEMLELTLCFVDTWAKEKVTTFFGDLEFILVVWVTKRHPRNRLPSPPDEVGHTMPGERMRQGQHYQHPLPLPPSPPNVISGGRMRHVQSSVNRSTIC